MTMISEPSCAAVRWDGAIRPILQLLLYPSCQRHTELYDRVTGTLSGTLCFTGQREENQSKPLQAVQVEGLWLSSEPALRDAACCQTNATELTQ